MKNEYTFLEEFINEMVVVCPQCENKAFVVSNPNNRQETKLTCTHCGFSKFWNGHANDFLYSHEWSGYSGILLGQPVDCYFKLPLWYTSNFRGYVLFAYNLNHLSFLKDFIENKLRERTESESGWRNSSLESRLPKWMQSSKNREGLIKRIDELRRK
jgi:hypothetical protein